MRDVHPVILELLRIRGITEEEDIAEYLSPKPKSTYNPFLLHNMEAGVDFVLSAIRSGKRICLYGDYDVDGITSICILRTLLSNLTTNLSCYIPSRFHEGYGLNRSAIEKLKEQGVDLILTVDCGSTSYDEVEYAKSLGMDVIVTDHHSIMDKKADCILINPKQKECQYPFKGLAGCGVAFKMAQALREKAGLPKSITNSLLDIVAIGTIGDIVPLIDENRTLAKYGLYELNRRHRTGITKLVEAISVNIERIASDQIAYCIVPHLNAAGRMDDAMIGVDLLLSQDDQDAGLLAQALVRHNADRKRVQENTFEECKNLKETQCPEDVFPMIRAEDAHEGITGIVAGKLKDIYGQPVVITTPCEGVLKGTGRSTDKIDMFRILDNFRHLFIRFGGHHGACGFLISEENFDELRSEANEALRIMIESDPEILESGPNHDMAITGKAMTLDLVEQLDKMEPFGCRNRRPVFRIENASITNLQKMGREGNHVRFSALCRDGSKAACVLFCRAEEYAGLFRSKEAVHITGTLQINIWNGTKKVQLLVDDIVPAEMEARSS